tara:strand:- start:1200 stop:1526 length:327 start_codon:yes stop_codon:yes gene_type:complete
MSKRKKVTYNELMERNDFLLSRLMEMERAVNYTHTLVISYIDCNGDQEKLKNHLKEIEDGQANGSSSKTNRADKSGDNKTVSKSSSSRKSNSKTANKNKATDNKSISK